MGMSWSHQTKQWHNFTLKKNRSEFGKLYQDTNYIISLHLLTAKKQPGGKNGRAASRKGSKDNEDDNTPVTPRTTHPASARRNNTTVKKRGRHTKVVIFDSSDEESDDMFDVNDKSGTLWFLSHFWHKTWTLGNILEQLQNYHTKGLFFYFLTWGQNTGTKWWKTKTSISCCKKKILMPSRFPIQHSLKLH